MARRLMARHYDLLAYFAGEHSSRAPEASEQPALTALVERGWLEPSRINAHSFRITEGGKAALAKRWLNAQRSERKSTNPSGRQKKHRKRKRGNPLNGRLPGSYGSRRGY